jgi:hypothetical protein
VKKLPGAALSAFPRCYGDSRDAKEPAYHVQIKNPVIKKVMPFFHRQVMLSLFQIFMS